MQVSRLALGSGMFGSLGNPDHDACIRIIHAALDAGINFVDTADFYSGGESEVIVGKALAGRRDRVVLATKFFAPMPVDGDDRNRKGASRRWIVEEVEHSLRRLRTDYLDVYQQHHFDATTALDETLGALSDLVHQGKVRVLGSSNFAPERIVEAQWVAERRGAERFRCEQASYSLFRRGIERAVLPTCARHGMGVIVWGPLDGSWLSGRFREAADFARSHRLTHVTRHPGGFDPDDPVNRRKLELVADLAALADDAGMPLSHLATAFTLEHPDVTAAILGPRTMEQLLDSLAAAERRLDPALLDALDALLPPGTDVAGLDPMGAAAPRELGRRYRRRGRG